VGYDEGLGYGSQRGEKILAQYSPQGSSKKRIGPAKGNTGIFQLTDSLQMRRNT
jgi:hypothetical protein